MRTLVRLMAVSAGTLAAIAIPSCTSTCEEEGNCGDYKPDTSKGGTAGASGNGGATGGRGGSSGTGGGEGGTGGADGGEGGTGGAGGMGGGEPPCDTGLSPSVESCIISDEHAVFVSPDGNDADGGTMAEPVATFERALEIAGARVVIACSGTYQEHVQVAAGARVYGGFDCDNGWTYEPAAPTSVEPDDVGYALEIRAVEEAIVIEDVEFIAMDAQATGESSVAAIVVNSDDVTIRRALFEAGAGADGANGTLTPFTYPARTELDGDDANLAAGGMPKLCTCPGGALTSGGGGGNAQLGGQGGGNGTPALGSGKGGTAGSMCNAGGGGGDGANAPDATRASGAGDTGALDANGWTPTPGSDGAGASPGQGGGGGASTATGGGGGGGCGSCGGAGAPGGKGGGASVALIVFGSRVTIEDSDLVASDAGDGGDAAGGQAGQPEAGFAGNQATGGCQGGVGGLGGRGAAGGGGAGGVSIGVLWKAETAPTLTMTMVTTGTRGSAGTGGDPGLNDGVIGVAVDELEIQ